LLIFKHLTINKNSFITSSANKLCLQLRIIADGFRSDIVKLDL